MVHVRRFKELDPEQRDKALNAMGRCRKALLDAGERLDFNNPTRDALEAVRNAINDAALVMTGCREFYAAQGSSGQPGKPQWVDSGT